MEGESSRSIQSRVDRDQNYAIRKFCFNYLLLCLHALATECRYKNNIPEDRSTGCALQLNKVHTSTHVPTL